MEEWNGGRWEKEWWKMGEGMVEDGRRNGGRVKGRRRNSGRWEKEGWKGEGVEGVRMEVGNMRGRGNPAATSVFE